MSFNSKLKATKIIAQRKAFYRKRIPESSCTRKETVDIDILVTSRNGDRKIMQSIRIMSRPPLRKRKWNQLSQFWLTSTKVIPIENEHLPIHESFFYHIVQSNVKPCSGLEFSNISSPPATTASHFLLYSTSWSTMQFCDKTQSSIHQIFTRCIQQFL